MISYCWPKQISEERRLSFRKQESIKDPRHKFHHPPASTDHPPTIHHPQYFRKYWIVAQNMILNKQWTTRKQSIKLFDIASPPHL
jgi:hypothetical protein